MAVRHENRRGAIKNTCDITGSVAPTPSYQQVAKWLLCLLSQRGISIPEWPSQVQPTGCSLPFIGLRPPLEKHSHPPTSSSVQTNIPDSEKHKERKSSHLNYLPCTTLNNSYAFHGQGRPSFFSKVARHDWCERQWIKLICKLSSGIKETQETVFYLSHIFHFFVLVKEETPCSLFFFFSSKWTSLGNTWPNNNRSPHGNLTCVSTRSGQVPCGSITSTPERKESTFVCLFFTPIHKSRFHQMHIRLGEEEESKCKRCQPCAGIRCAGADTNSR